MFGEWKAFLTVSCEPAIVTAGPTRIRRIEIDEVAALCSGSTLFEVTSRKRRSAESSGAGQKCIETGENARRSAAIRDIKEAISIYPIYAVPGQADEKEEPHGSVDGRARDLTACLVVS
jgi:hypothetical protein